jgi:sulfite exporter TauE/SafE
MNSLQVATDTANGGTLTGIFLIILALVLFAALITVPFLLRNISRRLDDIHRELRAQNPKTGPGRQVLGVPTEPT